MKLLNTINFFYHFWPKSGKKLALTSLKFGIFSYNCDKFPLRWFYNHCFLLWKVIPSKIWKKTNDITCLFTFFATLDIIWPKFCPKTTSNLIFFAGFQWSMLGNRINIKKFNWNPLVLKKIFSLTCAKLGPSWATSKTRNFFFHK